MYRQKKFSNMRVQSKYRNVFTPSNGHTYHSKFESQVSQDLDLLVKGGILTHYDRQVKIPLAVNGTHICNYFIDFVAYHKDGTVEYIEVKGFETEVWRMKWKIFEAIYSWQENVKLTIIKR